MFIDFLADAFGDMFNQMCKLQWMSGGRLKMPIVVRGCVGAAQSNAAHHSGNYYPFFMHIPGFRVVMPSTPADAKGLLKTAIRSDDPVLFLEHKNLLALKGPVPDGEYLIPFGQAAVRRTGTRPDHGRHRFHGEAGAGCRRAVGRGGDLGRGDRPAHAGAAGHGHDPGVGAQDRPAAGGGRGLRAVRRRRGDRHAGDGGRFDDLDAPVRRVNGLFAPAPYSPPLYEPLVPSVKGIVQAARELLAE